MESEETEEIVIRHVSGPTAGMRAVMLYVLGHLEAQDAEFSVTLRPTSRGDHPESKK